MEGLLAMDGDVLLALQEFVRTEAWNPFWTVVTSLGNGGIIWFAASFALLASKRTREIGIVALLSMAICFLFANIVLKNLVARIRPYEVVDGLTTLIPHPTDYSFPSGHTTASFACALVFARFLPRRYGVPALALATMIAFSRMYVGVHYLTDVLAGVAVALTGSRAALLIWKRRKHTNASADRTRRER